MADKAKDTTVSDRDAELARQAAVEKAVHAATHDKAGQPIPIRPDAIVIVEGKR